MIPKQFPPLVLADWQPTRDTLHGYAEIVGAVLETADNRPVEAPNTAGKPNKLLELLFVPVTAHIALASELIRADKMPVVLRLFA